MLRVSAGDRTWSWSSRRLRREDLCSDLCWLLACSRMIFPVPVSRIRFAVPLWLFCFGLSSVLFRLGRRRARTSRQHGAAATLPGGAPVRLGGAVSALLRGPAASLRA